MNHSPDNASQRAASDRELEQRAREIHAHAVAGVDAHTRARLAAARRNALENAHRPSPLRIWLPATGAFAAAALVLGVLRFHPGTAPGTPSNPPQQAAAADTDLPLDADSQQLELYQNLDFYQWLAQQPDTHAPHAGTKP